MTSIEKEFVDMYGKFGRAQGMGTMLTTIFATLYIEPKEISMDELAKKTGYSLASISNTVKMLQLHHMVQKRRKPGSKKIFLYTEKDVMKIMKGAMVAKEERILGVIMQELPHLLKKSSPKTTKEKQQFKIIENYYKQIIVMHKIMGHMIQEMDKALQKR